MAGDARQAARLKSAAQALGEKIHDDEDRKIFLGDLQSGPWFVGPASHRMTLQ